MRLSLVEWLIVVGILAIGLMAGVGMIVASGDTCDLYKLAPLTNMPASCLVEYLK